MPLQFRRGTDAQRTTITPAAGEPLWTTNTNRLYVGDGVTPGGVAVEIPLPSTGTFTSLTVTNIHFTGDPVGVNQTTAWTGTVAWSQIGSKPNGGLYTTSTVEFNQLSVTGSTIASTQSSILVNASGSLVYEPPHAAGYLVWGINDAGASARLVTDAYSGSSALVGSVWTGRKARGTAAAPTAVQSGDLILRLAGTGFGTTEFASTSSGYFEVIARENFTDGARGTQINLATTNVGTNTPNNSLTVASDGTIITAPQASGTESVLTINKTGLTSYPAPINVDGYDIWGIREGESARGVLDAYGTGILPAWQGRRARGTAAAPSAVQADDVLLSLRANGYGTTGYGQTSTAYINFTAIDNFTDTARGTRMQVWANPVGDNTANLVATFRADGVYVFSTATNGTGMLNVVGTYPNTNFEVPYSDTLMHGVAKPDSVARILLDAYGTDDPSSALYGSFSGRRAMGTAAAPTATEADKYLAGLRGYAYGTTGFLNTASAFINLKTFEAATNSAAGGEITLGVQQVGSVSTTTQKDVVIINYNDVEIDANVTATSYTVSGSGKLYQTGGALSLTNAGTVALVDSSGGSQVQLYGGGVALVTTNGALNATAGTSGLLNWSGNQGFQTNKITFTSDSTVQTTAWTGTVANSQITSVSTSKVTGLSVIGYTGKLSDGIGQISTSTVSGLSTVAWTGQYSDLIGEPNQNLDTSSNVTFASVTVSGNISANTGDVSANRLTVLGQTTLQGGVSVTTGTTVGQTISAGGFPLNSAGQALIAQSNTQSVAMIVSNYSGNMRPTLSVRAFGQNTPGGGATTAGSGVLNLEGGRGTGVTPTATGSADSIGVINFSGYDGASWLASQATGGVSNLPPASIFVQTAEAFANNGSTTTNAGTNMFMRLQPIATQLNSTSRRTWLGTSWTAGSTTTNSPPILGIGVGQGTDGTTPTLTPAGGVGSFGTGSGRTNFAWNAVQQFIQGVPSQDTAPDNATLTATNIVTFLTHRRSNIATRRNLLQSGDTVGGFNFNAQTTNNSSSNGAQVAGITISMVETAGAGAYGSRFNIQTVNTGTTTLATRMSLDDRLNQVRSDTHQFTDKTGSFTALSMTTATAVFTSIPVVPNYTAAAANAITGQIGAMVAISNSAAGSNPNGMLAFWDTTNARWSYIHDNSAV